jgi:hypothetical protein
VCPFQSSLSTAPFVAFTFSRSVAVCHGNRFARAAAAKTLSDPTSNVLEPYVWRDPERTVGRGIFIEVAQILHVDPFAIQALQDLVRAACPSFSLAAWVWWRLRCLGWGLGLDVRALWGLTDLRAARLPSW